MGFARQEYWSGLRFLSPGDLLDPGIEPGSPTLQADALISEPPGKPKNPITSFQVLSLAQCDRPYSSLRNMALVSYNLTKQL